MIIAYNILNKTVGKVVAAPAPAKYELRNSRLLGQSRTAIFYGHITPV